MGFIDYVLKRDVKRSHRENRIPKSDLKRLVKVLQPPQILRETEPTEGYWAEWISDLARKLGLISYDTEGIYAGYSSVDTSFPDNYIGVNIPKVERYMRSSSSERERAILNVLISENKNEFHRASLLGSQDRFDYWGSGVNAASRMKLPAIRRRLLQILAGYEPGKVIPFEEFVQRIKTTEPDLIIASKAELDEWKKQETHFHGTRKSRNKYDSFLEYRLEEKEDGLHQIWDSKKEINEKEADAFERVEGRYLAFFLEEIPVLMHFVRLHYSRNDRYMVSHPPTGIIQSFMVNENLRGILKGSSPDLDRVTVTVLPDFTLIVEAPLYPDREIAQLTPYTTPVSEDRHLTTLRIDRKKTVESLAADPSTPSLLTVLDELTDRIPQNVSHEVGEWTNLADRFVIYEEAGLLEFTDSRKKPSETIVGNLRKSVWSKASTRFTILRSPEEVFRELEELEQVPAKVRHPDNALRRELLRHAPDGYRPSRRKRKRKEAIEQVRLAEMGFIAYRSENGRFLYALAKHLRDAGVTPVLLDSDSHILAVPDTARSDIRAALKKLHSAFEVQIH